ncbi:hypothetical protein KJS94_14355 [Flavihumibacter rivuli]|uniref:hypothetical protein n=1 Tax=Flavihumibacter rivuli TaxID=2838156 RepID=UPI001BDE2987|nr:hypothetical protein [Flavihumibacter rivuli]ULQ55828.1 hypothetical protein KJS94_14355 [Flavihumibacter rivuli]
MRKLIAITLGGILLAAATSCNKDSGEPLAIQGKWELRLQQGGSGFPVNYAPGNGNYLQFSGWRFERISNGAVVQSGHYWLVKDNTAAETLGLRIQDGQFNHRIVFGAGGQGKTFIDVRDNRLNLLSGFFPLDGGGMTVYERVE